MYRCAGWAGWANDDVVHGQEVDDASKEVWNDQKGSCKRRLSDVEGWKLQETDAVLKTPQGYWCGTPSRIIGKLGGHKS